MYSADQVIGGLLEIDIPVGTGVTVKGVTIRDIILREIGTQGAAMKLYLFGTKPTVLLDHASIQGLALADVDDESVNSPIDLPAGLYKAHVATDAANIRRLGKPNVNEDIKLAPLTADDDNKFWAYLTPTGSVTLGAADVLKHTFDYWVD
jgi:hypothetical protein